MQDFISRFANPFQNKAQYAFEQTTSAHYRQFHEMKSEMPSDVLELFRANQIGFLKAPVKKKCRSLDPVSSLGMNLHQVFAIPNLQLMEEQKRQTRAERQDRIAYEKQILHQQHVRDKLQQWNPFCTEKITIDPSNTLFIGRLSYRTTEKDLKYEFQRYGLVKSAIIPKDQNDKSKGYGFVQFQLHEDFLTAYKHANNRRINGRRVIVDYERGRTSLSWRPRRLDGGLGGETRMLPEDYEQYNRELKAKKAAKKEQSREVMRERSRSKGRRRRDDRWREDDRYYDRNGERDYRDRDHHKRDRRSRDRKRQKKDKRDKRDRFN